MDEAVGLVLNYRDARRTLRCLRSLWEEGINHVLVWDNSADTGASTAELIRLTGRDTKLEIITSPENLGFARAVNRGIERLIQSHPGKHVLLINNDAVLTKGSLSQMTDKLRNAHQAWLVYPNVNHGGRVIGTVHYHRLTGILQLHGPALPGSFAYASGCCMLINPAKPGTHLFDEAFFMYGEDIELGYRLQHIPNAMLHVPQALVIHEGSASSGMASEFYENRIVAGHFLLAKIMSQNSFDLILMLTMHWAALIVRAAIRAIRYRSFSPLLALRKGWRIYVQEKR